MARTGRRRLSAAALAATTLSIGVASGAVAVGGAADPVGDASAVAVQVEAPTAGSSAGSAARAAAGARPIGLPVPGLALPSALDAQPVYVEQDSCDPYAKAGTKALAELLRTSFGAGGYGIERLCQIGAISEHKEGRAIDWMLSVNIPAQKAAADAATAWIIANNGAIARRLGIQYVIWNKRMWRAYAPERGWTVYTGSVPHTDHVHISLTWDGAQKRTSWWSGAPVARLDRGPCRVYAGQYAPIYSGRQLSVCKKTLPAAPASSYPVYEQGSVGTAVKVLQQGLGLRADGSFGAKTKAAVMALQKASRLPQSGVTTHTTWNRVESKLFPWILQVGTTLRRGSTGAAVSSLQKALKMSVDGTFGASTVTAVIRIQAMYGLTRDGIVGPVTWRAVVTEASR